MMEVMEAFTNLYHGAVLKIYVDLTLLYSERPKLYTILAFLSAVGIRNAIKLWIHLKHKEIGLNFITYILTFVTFSI